LIGGSRLPRRVSSKVSVAREPRPLGQTVVVIGGSAGVGL
jgi:hypothetical protein